MDRSDGKISDFLHLQRILAEEKGWTKNRTPEHAPMSILWSIDELGEAIAIIKKKGAAGIMENESVRAHFVEEVADTFMYLFDMMESYGITAEEFTDAYVRKFEKNMGRSWHENDAMYETCMKKLIIFDMEGTLTHEDAALPDAARFLEVAATTDLHLALVSDLPAEKVKAKLTDAGLSPDAFEQILTTTHYAEAFTEAAAHCGVRPEETVVCSASMVGVKVAGRYGMTAVAIKARFSDEMYKKAGADHVCGSLMQLQDILGFAE